jgi:hypothetical protein
MADHSQLGDHVYGPCAGDVLQSAGDAAEKFQGLLLDIVSLPAADVNTKGR